MKKNLPLPSPSGYTGNKIIFRLTGMACYSNLCYRRSCQALTSYSARLEMLKYMKVKSEEGNEIMEKSLPPPPCQKSEDVIFT